MCQGDRNLDDGVGGGGGGRVDSYNGLYGTAPPETVPLLARRLWQKLYQILLSSLGMWKGYNRVKKHYRVPHPHISAIREIVVGFL